MQYHYAYRAAKVLYDFLVSNQIKGTFLLPVNVCESVPDTFREAGCSVHFMDIQEDTLCIDEKQVLDNIESHTGILLVHTYGTERCFDSFYKSIRTKSPNAIIIDDRCLCMPDFEEGQKYEQAEADLTLFSFGNKKQVQLGEGGLGIINERWKCDSIKVKENTYFENKPSIFNKSEYLSQKLLAKQHVAKLQAIYSLHLPADISLPSEFNNWRYNILVPEEQKNSILKSLFDNGLFASSHYKPLDSTNNPQKYTHATKLQQEIVNLFIDPLFYTEAQAFETCSIINQIIQ